MTAFVFSGKVEWHKIEGEEEEEEEEENSLYVASPAYSAPRIR
jgi:hypothetical protein